MMSYRKPGEFLLLLIILIAALATPAMAGLVLPNDTGTGAAINPETLSLPLSFIENQGQAPDAVKYQVNAAGHSIAFEPDRIVLTASQDVNDTTRSAEVTMTFPGSSASPAIAGLERLPGNVSFFLGNDSTKWQSDVPTYRSIEYQQLYPGVDLRYNGTLGVLKREFVVAPGASPDQIAIAYDGIDGLALAADGSLAITTSLGVLTDEAPVAYQAIDGVKVPVTSSYRLKDDGTVGFTIGAYDQSRPLIIDPTLLYSSYFGGSSSEEIHRVRLDSAGNIYIAGQTTSADLPVQNANQGSRGGSTDAFVTKLNPEGTAVLYSSYLGGSGNEAAQGLSVDGAGNIYLSGGTKSTDFPLQSPIQTAVNDTTAGFVTKLNPSNPPGSQLVYSTYLGSTSTTVYDTGALGIAVDSSGDAYVTGYSFSTTLPVTADAAQRTNGGRSDAYLAKIAPDGSLSYFTYLGGSLDEGSITYTACSTGCCLMGIGLDPAGNVYVTGSTKSSNFPTLNPFQSVIGAANRFDVYVAKYTSNGSKVYASYLGGSGPDQPNDLAVDAAGAVFVTGVTQSTNFPRVNPAQSTIKGTVSSFITKINPSGTAVEYSTYWGGTGSTNNGNNIAVDAAGNAYVAGITTASDFPLINGTQQAFGGSTDGYVVKLAPSGSTALYSTVVGSSNNDYFYGIAVTDQGDAVVGGSTTSATYPTTDSAYQKTLYGTSKGVLTILTDKAVAGFTATPTSGYAPLAVQFTDASTGSPTNWSWDFGDNTTSTEQNPVHTYASAGIYSVNLTASNSAVNVHLQKTDYITVLDQPALPAVNFTANVTTGIAPLSVQFNDTSLGENLTAWSWAFGDGTTSTEQNPVHTYTLTGNYTVNLTVTNTSGSNSSVKADYILVSTQPQPVANFTANVTTGIAPLAVQFNDTSLGENLTAWSWDFGDGNISTVQNPINNYTTAGTYSVNLTVTNTSGSNSSVKTNYITVTASEAPTANFIANITNGTAPLAVQFNDTSVGANLTNWSWDFTNDGFVDSIEQNPIFNYTTAGNHTVNLTVTNATGSDSEVKAGFITVSAPVVPTVAPVTGVIPASSNVNLLVANSAGARFDDYGNDTYNFFNTAQSSSQGLNALHITTDPVTTESGQVTTSGSQSGTFYLTDTGGRGWDDDGVLMLAVNGAIPDDFKVNIHASGYTWTPVLTGSYPTFGGVTLSPDALNETFTKADFIYGPQIWRPSPGTATTYPIYNAQDMANTTDTFSLMFIDLNAGILGGGTRGQASFSGQTLANNGAIRVDYSFENLTTFAAFDAYAYTVSSNQGQGIRWTNRLSDTGASGFAVTGVTPPSAPVANFTANVTNGTAPLPVQFTDLSTGSPTSWSWDFGDGNTSTVQSPSHTYAAAGNYTVNLTATSAGGSNTSVKTNYITVTSQVTPTPTVTPVAGGVLPDYNNIFVRVANDAGVQYDAFGNDSYNIRFEGYDRGLNALHISTDPAVNFGQVTRTAAQSGTFYATDSGGKGYEDEILLLVGVNGTVPDDFRLHVTADGYTWTPNPVSNQAPTSYTYNGTTLDETFTKADLVYGPQTWRPTGNGFSYPIYAGQDTADATNTFKLMFIDLNAGVLRPNAALNNRGAVRITYSFENLTSFAAFNVYGYCQNSNNGNNMVAWSNSLMPDKTPSGYSVMASSPAPVAGFTANVTNGTAPLSVGFTDQSTGSPTSWSWSFGDGNTSTVQNPSHTFAAAGNYTVNLTATNVGGSNSSVKTNYITVTTPVTPAPVAGFSANITNGTAPLSVGFTDQSTGTPTSWSWSFGDNGTSTVQSPSHTYTTAGIYTVNLTATNAGGSNTSTRTGYITVRAPATPTTVATTIAPTIPTTIATTVPTTVPTTTTVAPTPTATQQPVVANFTANVTAGQSPLAVQFTDLTTGSIRQYFWQFGDGGASFDQNPVHVYTAAGTYTVSLVAIGSTGSQVKTIAQYITVTAPGAPTQTVTPTLTITTPATTTVIPTPTVTTTIPVTTTVTPLPTSPGHDLPIANFVVTYQGGAGSMGIQVIDASTNATTVKYDLGDGTTTAYKNFRYTYWQPGTYTITLTATNDAGTTEKTVTVTMPAGSPTTTTVAPTVTVTTPAPTTTTVTPTQTPADPNLPVANFTVTFPGGLGSMGIQVTNTAVNATSVRYNLGDGATTAYPNFTYTYWQPGNYTINQTATNAAGSTNKTLVVTVPAVSTPTTIPTTIPTTTTVSPTATTTGPVYNGTHLIPGQLQAEDYDLGGEGVAYHDTTTGNEGGVYRHDDVDIETLDTDRSPNVGWVRTGEWLAYTVNIGTAGTYDAGFRVASSHAGSSFQVYLDDGTTPIATVNVPNTGDWLAFQTISVPVTLPAGQHRLKLAFPTDYANINWIDFTPRA
jgi:PKD repeat protein